VTLADVRWIAINHNEDERGTLTALEDAVLPFRIRRLFYMHRVPAGTERGAHAHRETQQYLVAVAGRFTVDVSDGRETGTFVLDDPNRGLYLPAMTWVRLHDFESGTVALVLCDRPYVPEHVIRDWDDYRRAVQEGSLTA
jgi:dTDP-4-dehydrorhamnose 3,5-epimerase-like enzyme